MVKPSITMSVKEVAAFLYVCEDTVLRYLHQGYLTGVKIHGGRVWRVHRSSVNDFFWERYVSGRPA